MNDIEILEHLEKMQKTFIEDGLQGYEMVIVNTKNLIENLIQRNKELKEINTIFALEGSRVRLELYIKENYIPKSKIKEKMKLLREDIQYSANPLSIDNSKYAIEVLQELLEESDK